MSRIQAIKSAGYYRNFDISVKCFQNNYTYINETSTDGKSLYVYVIRLSRGFSVFGITSRDARLHVTNRLVSSQTHFSGHIPYTPDIRAVLPAHINKKTTKSIVLIFSFSNVSFYTSFILVVSSFFCNLKIIQNYLIR